MRVIIEFKLEEDVTPDIFAARVAEACIAYGALRPGEVVRAANSAVAYTKRDEGFAPFLEKSS